LLSKKPPMIFTPAMTPARADAPHPFIGILPRFSSPVVT
jgi:hypothetical protein